MGDLVERSTVVVKRYGGTVDKFTGDGIMAVFGAPVALGGSRRARVSSPLWAFKRRRGNWPPN